MSLQAWESDVESTIVSKLHSEVSQVMGSLGVSHNIERITDDGLFSADILIEDDKVIVEVDGPHHFTVNTHQPLGECPALQVCLDQGACTLQLLLVGLSTCHVQPYLLLIETANRLSSWLLKAFSQPEVFCLCFAAGATLCRRELLAARGWTMLSVPYFDWVKGQGNINAQKQYLRDLLVPHVKTVIMED